MTKSVKMFDGNLDLSVILSDVELPVVGYQWLHHDPATGNEFWLNSKFLSGKRSNTSRPLYLDPKPAIIAALSGFNGNIQ